jgi:hypothetical protein
MKKFRASFSSTGKPELDAELRRLELHDHLIADIVGACRTYDVSAQILGESGRVLGRVEQGGYPTSTR